MDIWLLTLFNQTLTHPWLDGLMVLLTTAGLAALPALGLLLLARDRQRRAGVAILVALAASVSAALIFQGLTLRPRPEAVRLLLTAPNFPAYPSGHAAAAFGVAVMAGLLARRRRWWLAGLAFAGSIAFSRVYLGHHYPSDVLAGACLGAGVGAACYGLVARRRPDWRWLLWLQVALVLVISHMAYLGLLPFWLLTWPLSDKVFHFVLFGLVVFWLNLWLRGRRLPWGRWQLPLAIVLPLTIALVEEGLQSLSPIRTADVTDLVSDLAGMLFFWWLSQELLQRGYFSREGSIVLGGGK